MKPRRGKPMVSRPYSPESLKPAAATQHAVLRRLGPAALDNPALRQIVQASNELASELGKTADRLTDEEADRAIETGQRRHGEGQ